LCKSDTLILTMVIGRKLNIVHTLMGQKEKKPKLKTEKTKRQFFQKKFI
jgi:hypothetical protein